MLEHLFGSKTRVKLLQIFLNNPSEPHYLRELARVLKIQLNAVRREIANLEKIGIIKSVDVVPVKTAKKGKNKRGAGSKKYFLADSEFLLYPELKALMLKAQLLLERDLVSKIERLAKLKLLILSGIFVGAENQTTDMLIVGSVNRNSLAKIIRQFEKQINREINYTVLSYQEYKYRQDITDRFLYDILEGKKMIIVSKL